MPLSAPVQLTLAFAQNGVKNTIPNPSQIAVTPGLASFNDGFPPLTRTAVAAGGVPPFGEDMNGVLFALSQSLQWEQAGGRYPFSSAFATAVGGYPLSAIVQASDGSGSWLNTTANNTNDPEAVAAPNGWQPVGKRGITSVALTNANVTLTNLQSANETVVFTGVLTGNVVVTVSQFIKDFKFVNLTTGAFTVSVKTPAGAAIGVAQGGRLDAYGDGTTLNVVVSAIASGVVGSVRNLAMSVAVASASGTLTADEIVVESALGGVRYCLANFNKTINLTTTGAGGMDTGVAPSSSFVALYAIYNPTTNTAALLAQSAAGVLVPNIYGGANMPAGYTASALLQVLQTNALQQFPICWLEGRTVHFNGNSAISTATQQGTPVALSLASIVPKNAKTVGGAYALGSSAITNVTGTIGGSVTNISAFGFSSGIPAVNEAISAQFENIPMITQQTLYYTAQAGAGTMQFNMTILKYTI